MNKRLSFIFIFIFILFGTSFVFAQGSNVSTNNLSELFKAAAEKSKNAPTPPPAEATNAKSLQEIFTNASKVKNAEVAPPVPAAVSVNMPSSDENDKTSEVNVQSETPPTPPEPIVAEKSKSIPAENPGEETGLSATAKLESTLPDSKAEGKATFTETSDGLKIKAEIKNVKAGKHGIHIHVYGNCADQAKAAGDHLNPNSVKHGNVAIDGLNAAHAGDLFNITADEKGNGSLEIFVKGLTLKSGEKYNVSGLALVVDENEDDLSQNQANAGKRIICGVIEVKN